MSKILPGVNSLNGQNFAVAKSCPPDMPAGMPYDPKRVADMVNSHRERTKMSWNQFAEKVGVRSGTLRAVGKGQTQAMRIDNAYALARAMGVHVWDLFGDEPEEIVRARELIRRLQSTLTAMKRTLAAREALEEDVRLLEEALVDIDDFQLGGGGPKSAPGGD